ncbi:Ig-like domain-containing protein [Marinifilum fragile]|uniref:Ig-like domain-containing protein n=1 Tax=Marinifilum fragile TaxID=570161 RepID=UPI0006D2281B|nr:gliding motility-associated C-terminal domain-containing protein [Marinifilum fragile]
MRNDKIFTRFKKILKSISIFILLAIPLSGFAQYDYEHYVPPFYCSSQVGKQEVFLSTNSEKDINVYIEDGQGNPIAGPFTINRNQSDTYVFRTPGGATYSQHSNKFYPDGCSYSLGIIGPKELNKPLDGQGLRIYSYDGPFFANIRHGYSNRGEGGALTHGFSLSAKGAYAKGKEFYSGHLYGHTILNGDPLDYYYYPDTRPIRSHSISVMAVEDGVTTVTFSGIKCKYITKYEGGKVVLRSIAPNETITVNLNKGQTYTLGTNLHSDQFGSESIEVRNGMNGTHITSTKDIVVNSGSWTAGAKPSQDIGFDQIVPVDQVRDKYIVMKGLGSAEPDPTAYHAGQERTIVVATQANTEVWVNEVLKGTLAEPGDFMILDDIVNPDDIPTLFINSKGKDVYVYQTMCGTNEDWINIGLNFIPPLTALGMKEVVIPKAEQITSGDYINPTVTVLAQKNVNVKHNGVTLTNPNDILGSTEWVYYKVSGISGDCRFTGDKAINVAWTASSNTLGAAGYYSGFTKAVSPIHPDLNIDTDLGLICESYDDDIIVSIKDNTGRNPDFYEWYKEVINSSGEIEWEGPNFINSSLKIPAPNENTTWEVRAYYRDPSLEILFNGDFLDGYNGFDSYYELVTNNLVDPGQFAITGRPKDENPILNDFNPIGGWKMLLAYSKNQNDTIYRSAEMEVESGFNYIFKMYGRLAQSDAAKNQSLKILINNETIVENFRIDRSDDWQSVSALWRPNGARNASIKILNNNLNGEGTFFAIDSISFVQAVEDKDLFEAKVIPNYSYSNNGKTFQFCQGVENSLDVSNGDTSWYSYSWSKKEDVTGNYIDLEDIAGEFSGTKTHQLIFLNPQQDDEGDYRCTISFKEEYKNCGTSTDDVHVDLSVLVDEPATIDIEADKTYFCFGTSANLKALVTGDAGQVKWYVNGGEDPVSLENPFVFSGYDAGTYTVRCEAENGCGLAFDEVTLEVLSAPVLNSLIVNPDLCESKDIILTADATGNGTIAYNWKEGTTDLSEHGSILKFPATMAHRDLSYSVSATSVYTTVDGNVECPSDLTIPIDNLDIYPNVAITDPLEDANLCEGSGNHTFSVSLSQPESFYNFSWQKDGVDVDGVTAQKIITPIKLADAGQYKVAVSNRCDSKESVANLTVVPKMIVNGITTSATGPFCSPTNVTVTFDDNGAVADYRAKKPDGSEIAITNPYTFEVNTTTEGAWEFIAVPNCNGDNFTHKFTWNLIPDFGAVSMNDVATCIGRDVDFVVDVKDVSPLSELTYEWKDNTNTTIVGENKDYLSLTNVQDADLGQYTCIVTDQCGNSKTATANLSIEKVTTSKTGTEIEKCVGDTDFRIDIAYTGTPIFEWRFNDPWGAVISNADFYEIPSVSTSDAGVYYCKVILGCGDEINIERELIVHEHVSIVSPADETIHICQGEQPVLNIEVNGDADIYTVSWTDDVDNPLVGFGDVNQVQLSKHDIPGTYTYKAKVTSLGNCDNLEKKYIVQVHEKPILSTIDNNVNKCAGLIELKITESGEHNGISWWKDGVLVTDGNAVATDFVINPATSPDDDGIYVAKVSSDYCGDNQVSINLDVRNNIAVTGKSPATTTFCENEEVSLFVTANAGGDEIHYKWYKETEPGTTLSDQPTYNISNIDLTQAGTYKVELYNDLGCGNQTLSFDVVVNKTPTVTNPSDKIICETETSVDFTVTGDAQDGANYQWYNSAGEIAGATSATYTETTLVDGENYYCEVTGTVGSCGTATSEKATLSVIKEVAVTNPVDLIIADGADATFSVVASGEPNYSYQWQVFDGAWKDINDVDKYSGTQTSELKITNALKADFNGNQYRCVVISDGTICSSSATSDFATLTILAVNKIAIQPTNQLVCEGEDIVFTVTGTKSTGLTYQWQYHTGDNVFVDANIADVSTVGAVSTYTIVNASQAMEAWGVRCIVKDGSSSDQPSNEVGVDVWENIVVATALTNTITICEGSPLSLTVDATAGEKIKYEWTKSGSGTVLQTGSVLNLGNAEFAESGTYTCKVYNDQNCNNVNIVYNVTVQENAKIKLHPLDKAICASDVPVFFEADGTAEGTVTYEWFDKGGNLVGTTKTLTIAANPENGQSYYCVVLGDVCNSATTDVANLTVYEEVVITDPSDQTASDGESVTFSVSATGEPTIEYKWYEKTPSGVWTALAEGGIYSGVSTANLTIDPVSLSMNANQYKCEAWSSTCSAVDESNFATLTILAVNKIAIQPTNQVVCEGEDIVFTVTGTKTTGLTYQWQYHTGDNVFVDANIADVSTVGAVSTYTIANASQAMEAWGVRCIVKDGSSSDQPSNEVGVDVWENIVVATALTNNLTVCEGSPLSLTVDATAGEKIKYEWTKSGSGTVLQTGSVLNLGNAELAESGTYTCKVYNDQNCNNINIVYNVTVQENAKIKLHPLDKAICASDVPVFFEADGTAEGTVTYEWFDKGGNLVGTTKTLTIASNPENGQSYYCVVSGDVCNSATTNVANLTVYEEVVITDPWDQTASDGESVTFSVSATGEPIIEYKWYEKTPSGVWTVLAEGGIYSGVSTANLTIDPVSLSMNANQYKCEAWSSTCSAIDESDFATLTILAVNKIAVQPTNQVVCEGEDIVFTVTGSKTTGLTYQWQYHTGDNVFVDANIADVSTVGAVSTYTIANASQTMEAWGVRCIVKDGSSADDISNEVKVEVFKPVVFTPVDDQILCFDESKQIKLDVTAGTTPLTYSWTKDATEVSTTAIVNIGTGDNGNYHLTVGNGVCPDVSDDFTVVHRSQLSLNAWSNSSEFCLGSLETLSVSVKSFDPALTLSYKWYKDGGEIPGATNADYTFTPVDKSESGQYKVEVSDGCSAKFVSGYVNVYESVTTVNKWVDPDDICVGSELNLEVDVTGDVKSYTWTHNGNPITATTNYLVAAVTNADAGTYQCIVEDHCGNTYTYTSHITIMDAPSIDGDGIEKLIAVCEGDPLVLGTISVTGSYDAIEWTLNNGSTNTVAGVQLNLGDATTAMEGNYKVEVSNKCGSDVSVGTQVVNPKPTLSPIADQTVCENEDVVFRAKATGRDLNYQWKIDGIPQPSAIATLLISGTDVLPADEFTPKVYTVECTVTNDNGCGETLVETAQLTVNPSTIILATLKNVVRFVGQDYTMTVDATGHNLTYTWTHVKDGVTTTLSEKTNSLTLTNIQFSDEGYYNCEIEGTCATRLATGKLTVKEPVVIIDGLVSLEEKCVGEPLSLSIDATGQISSIKWFKDGFEIPGETKLTLYIAELKATDAGVYTCKIEGEGAPVNGIVEETTVRVYENTTLLAALGTKTVCEGQGLEWIPNVKGAANIKYKWFFGGVEISDQKILNYNPTLLTHEGNYEVQVTGLCGNVTTRGSLEVTELPVIISVSDNVEICENTSLVEFSVSATGEELKYQWRKNGTDIAGKTSPVLSLTSIQLDDEANYTCKVYNSCAEAISDEMTLKVIPQLRILSEMVDVEVCSGEEVTLTTDVEGNDVTYQWKLDGVDLTGENASILNLGKTSPDDSGYYTCIVSDRCTDSRSTKPTELKVHELPNSRILGRMVLCAKEDRVTYTTDAMPEIEYGWGVEGGIFAGPDKGLRTRITWGELDNGELSIMITDVVTGCESKVDSLVTLHALPDVNLALVDPVRGVCNPSKLLSGGYPEGGIYWVDDISEEVFDPAERGAGTYNVHYSYTDENGCSNVTSKTILRVDPLPTVNITDDITIGSCKPFKLSAETEESNIQWSPAADLDDANSMTPTFTPGKSQVLVATVMDEHGCTNMDLVELTVSPLPIVTTISDTTVGQCNQLQLLTDIVGDAGEITWTNPDHLDDPNTRSPKIVNAPEGTYTYKISVTDLYGCDAEGEVIVNMVADPKLEEDKFACEGEKFEVNIAGMENPIWEDGYTDINRTIDQPGKYLLTVENKYGCGDEQNFVINPTPKPDLRNNLIYTGPREIELVKDRPVTIFEGQTVTLAPNLPLEYSPYNFEWEDGKEGSILQRYEVSETGKYKLTVTDNLGCISKDSVDVEVKPVGIESPNAFTPNSSNDNDKFYLKDINYDIEKFEMYIYNRWGELMYKTNEVGRNGGWDGKYKGKLCPAGAYVWMVFINGDLTNQGTFMLIR